MPRLPKTPEELRAAKAARQARWRKRKAIREAVDASGGLIPHGSTALPATATARDLADVLLERGNAIVATLPDGDLMDKDRQPFISNLLRAQGLKDAQKRDKNTSSGGMILAFLRMLDAPGPMQALDDGLTVEGEFTEGGDA